MVPVSEVFVHRLSSSRPNGVCVLPNLIRDIDQRDHDGKSADNLSEIRQVVEIHRFQLQPSRRLRSIAPAYFKSVLQLALVFRTVKVAF